MGSIAEPTPQMATKYVVKEARSKEELDQIMDVIWAANYTPYDPIAQIVFPVLGFTPADREASLLESKERFWQQHLADPSSHWYYAVDIATAKAVGCCQWQIFKSNPFPNGSEKLRAPWWPEGEHREFCEAILNQVYKCRSSWMRRPHFALNWMAVIPSLRRLGIGSLLMNHGISQADSLNLECWLEASAMGQPLYDKFGFQPILRVAFDTEKEGASDVWRKCQHEMTPGPFTTMWRPKAGMRELPESEAKMPWELGEE